MLPEYFARGFDRVMIRFSDLCVLTFGPVDIQGSHKQIFRRWIVASSKFGSQRVQFLSFGSELLMAMANPVRIEILTYLSEEEISVGNLGEKIGLSQSALSQHLAKLRSAGLVTTRRDAQTIYYHTASPAVEKTLNLLKEFFDEADRD